MAASTSFSAPILTPITKTTPLNPNFPPNFLPMSPKLKQNDLHKLKTTRRSFAARFAAAATCAAKTRRDERVQKIHSIEEFDGALRAAQNRLVVDEYAEHDSENSSQIYLFMVDLSRSCNDVEFLLVMGDESEETRKLCACEKIEE